MVLTMSSYRSSHKFDIPAGGSGDRKIVQSGGKVDERLDNQVWCEHFDILSILVDLHWPGIFVVIVFAW